MKKLMYIENKTNGLSGPARIGWVEFSKSTRTMYYRGLELLKCVGYKYNCIDAKTGDGDTADRYWVSGPKKRGGDRLYSGVVEIDEDAREEYWCKIREIPESKLSSSYKC